MTSNKVRSKTIRSRSGLHAPREVWPVAQARLDFQTRHVRSGSGSRQDFRRASKPAPSACSAIELLASSATGRSKKSQPLCVKYGRRSCTALQRAAARRSHSRQDCGRFTVAAERFTVAAHVLGERGYHRWLIDYRCVTQTEAVRRSAILHAEREG